MNAKEELLFFAKGMLMGMADIIPGVSGGTIAFITGIYSRLVFGIKNVDFGFLRFSLRGDFSKAKKNFLAIDFSFFIPLLAGIALSFLFFSRIIRFALEFHPVPTFAFFFGLILASAKIVYGSISQRNFQALAFAGAGFAFAFLFTGLTGIQADHSAIAVFASGAIAVCAMILPGISGAFILLFLGQYEFLLQALHNLDLVVIFLFIAGALIGILLFSRLLAFLLKRHKSSVMAFLTGLMLGALRIPLEKASAAANLEEVKLAVAFALAGVFLVLLLDHFAGGALEKPKTRRRNKLKIKRS